MILFLFSNFGHSSIVATGSKITIPSGLPVAEHTVCSSSEAHQLQEDPSGFSGGWREKEESVLIQLL